MKSNLRASAPILVLAVLLAARPAILAAAEPPAPSALRPAHAELIALAGNAEDDAVRLRHLQKLAHDLAPSGRNLPGLERLMAFIERWLSPASSLAFFGGEIARTQDFDFGMPADSPLRPIADWYRARMLVWVTLESSGIYTDLEKRAVYLGKARRLLEGVRAVFPENRIVRLYLGEPYPAPQRYEAASGAPAWAVWQREGLERLADVVEWWIDHRMRSDGQYGGGWGDDCEMWRRWVPVLIGFDSPKMAWAQSYFSRQLLRQPHLAGGYHRRVMDVEHSAEDLADALTPMMHLEPQNPEWEQRVRRLAELMENLWTGTNERGFLQFKSTFFSSEQVDLAPARACDTVYHPRAVQPALLYWLRTRDPHLTRLVGAWLDTWVDAAARAERGKPAGVLPTAIHWPDGRVGGTGEHWWRPENYSEPLYNFPSAMGMMAQTLLLAFHVTGEARYLAPLQSMAQHRLDYLKNPPAAAPPGSAAWCAQQMHFLGKTLAKYRLLTGDRRFDALLEREDLPYTRFRLGGDSTALTTRLRQCAEVLRDWWPGFTSEVRYTDRVFRFPILFEPGFLYAEGRPVLVFEKGALAIGLNALDLLYSTATGDPGDPLYFPMNAVRWHTPPREIAALVTAADSSRLTAELFHFGAAPRPLEAEFFLLAQGRYTFALQDGETGAELRNGEFTIAKPEERLRLELPPGKLCRLKVEPRP